MYTKVSCSAKLLSSLHIGRIKRSHPSDSWPSHASTHPSPAGTIDLAGSCSTSRVRFLNPRVFPRSSDSRNRSDSPTRLPREGFGKGGSFGSAARDTNDKHDDATNSAHSRGRYASGNRSIERAAKRARRWHGECARHSVGRLTNCNCNFATQPPGPSVARAGARVRAVPRSSSAERPN